MKATILKRLTGTLIIAASLTATAFAAEDLGATNENSSKELKSGAKGDIQEVEKPLNVNGQTRNLSMMLTFNNGKEQVQFFDVRKNYQEEVPKTFY